MHQNIPSIRLILDHTAIQLHMICILPHDDAQSIQWLFLVVPQHLEPRINSTRVYFTGYSFETLMCVLRWLLRNRFITSRSKSAAAYRVDVCAKQKWTSWWEPDMKTGFPFSMQFQKAGGGALRKWLKLYTLCCPSNILISLFMLCSKRTLKPTGFSSN